MRLLRCALCAFLVTLISSCIASPMQQLRVITSTGLQTIEPALNDFISIEWRGKQDSLTPSSVLILQESSAGSITDSSSGKHYKKIDEVAFSQKNKLLSARWPEANAEPEKISVGRIAIATKRPNGQLSFTSKCITVAPTISYLGFANHFDTESANQNKATVVYTLSHQVSKCTISVAGKKIKGTTNAGLNTLVDAWDGKTSKGEPIAGEWYDLSASTVPACGPKLKITGIQVWKIKKNRKERCTNLTFNPKAGERIEIRFRLSEPVVRRHATEARLNADIYHNGSASPVRLLAYHKRVNLDSSSNSRNRGLNSIIWDGKYDDGNLVDPGTYGIILEARDNAGQSCSSPSITINLNASYKTPKETAFPEEKIEIYPPEGPEDTGFIRTEPGRTVSWSHSVSGVTVSSGVTKADKDGGTDIEFKHAWGQNKVSVTATKPGKPTHHRDIEYFSNEIKATSGALDSSEASLDLIFTQNRFHPDKGEKLTIWFTSKCDDEIEASIRPVASIKKWPDPYVSLPISCYINGAYDPAFYKRTWSNLKIKTGLNSMVWDGLDDNGNPMQSGLYIVAVGDFNNNVGAPFDAVEVGFETMAILDRTNSTNLINNIDISKKQQIVTASWQTRVPTRCLLITQSDRGGSLQFDLSTEHSFSYCPGNVDEEHIWVLAEDSNGNSELSPMHKLNFEKEWDIQEDFNPAFSDTGFEFFPETNNTAVAEWKTNGAVFGGIKYAKLGASLDGLQWKTIRETKPSKRHSFTINNLEPGSEYAVQFQTAETQSFEKPLNWGYRARGIKNSEPALKIISPRYMEPVSGVIDVEIEACDPVRRFTDNGILKIELSIDGNDCTNPKHESGSSHYTYRIDTTKLRPGFHHLCTYAYDEFGNTSQWFSYFIVPPPDTGAKR